MSDETNMPKTLFGLPLGESAELAALEAGKVPTADDTPESTAEWNELWREDLDLMIRWQAHEYHLEFRARKCAVCTDNTVLYYREDERGMVFPDTENFDEGERVLDGSLKWDGCMNVSFGDEEGYMHICGWDGWIRIARIFPILFGLAHAHVRRFDASIACYDPRVAT